MDTMEKRNTMDMMNMKAKMAKMDKIDKIDEMDNMDNMDKIVLWAYELDRFQDDKLALQLKNTTLLQ